METLQIASATIILLAAVIPLYFAIKVKTNKQILLSSILLTSVLVTYGIHAILESVWHNSFALIFEICFAASIVGTILSYTIFHQRTSHALVSGIFGLAILSVFVTWMVSEIVENFLPVYSAAARDLTSSVMIGFGILIFARFFWLKRILGIQTLKS
ncbi:MAG: hypothetical protein WD018_04650 [Nitrosopumilaceae archaeon]